MIDTNSNLFGYEETSPPLLVRGDTVFGTGQLPKFADDLFQITDGRWLIPTAEVPLTAQIKKCRLGGRSIAETLYRPYALFPFRGWGGRQGYEGDDKATSILEGGIGQHHPSGSVIGRIGTHDRRG